MKEEVFHLDFNYESILAGSNKSIKGASWFDHIFYFINESKNTVLKSNYPFEKKYLEYISSLGVPTTKTTSKGASKPWWGNYEDLELCKTLNSKIEMTKLGLLNNWVPVPTTIETDKVKELKFPIIAREEWGFSGRGSYSFQESDEIKLPKGKYVFSSKILKDRDFGITFDFDNNSQFVVENYIDELGQFRGGRLIGNDEFNELVGNEGVSLLLEIRRTLKEMGAKNSIQVDTFTYQNSFHPFVEVNYRKTMGLMVKSLEKYLKGEFIAWIIVRNKSKINYEKANIEISKLLNENTNIKILSPVDKFISLGISTNCLRELELTKIQLEKLFS